MTTSYQDIGYDVGPLQHVYVGMDSSFNVRHVADTDYQFYPQAQAVADTGTFLAYGTNLYAPDFANHGTTAATATVGTYLAWYQAGQSNVVTTDGGMARVTTILETASATVRVYQTDTYVSGQDSWRTDMIVENNGTADASLVLYRAGDAYLHASNNGYGTANAQYSAPGVATGAGTVAGTSLWFYPVAAGNYIEAAATSLWAALGSKTALPDTVNTASHDAALGVSWSMTLPPRSFTVRSALTQVRIPAPVVEPGSDAWHFRGFCYRGPDGDTSTPLSGVTLRLWVERTTAPVVGRYIKRTAVSDASGYWNFYEDVEFTTYEVEVVVPSGMTSTGVSTLDGTIISTTLLKWTSPARGVHAGNRFFMQ